MGFGTTTQAQTDFGQVSRVKGTIFRYASFFASIIGLLALGVLLAYVAWDAFGLGAAEPMWYGLFGALVGLPVAGFMLYTKRNPLAGWVALELLSTVTGGLLTAITLVVILDIIAGPGVWFSYFLTVLLPAGVLLYLNHQRPEMNWVGLGLLGVMIVGPVIGTLGLGLASTIATLWGAPGTYYLSVVIPMSLGVRYLVSDYWGLGDGRIAAGVLLIGAIIGVPIIDSIPAISRSVWLFLLAGFITPTALITWKNLAASERRIGFLGPVALIGGGVLLTIVPGFLGIRGPQPWFDWGFLTAAPSRFPEQAGLYPAIIGSVFIIVLVALITLLVGVGAALYLEEYAPTTGKGGRLTRLIRINISNLAGVPSVVYGILGLAVFANMLGLGFGTVITAAFTLSLLILPIVIISAREAMAAVPESLRNASYGMGATRWQTTRNVVIPRAIPGILTGTILALGRAIGETAPLIMIGLATTKFSPPDGLFSQTTAMPMQIFAWSDYAQQEFQYGVVAAGVVTLLIVLLTMNSIAILLRNKFEKEAY